jgi:anti-anti-sigma factor
MASEWTEGILLSELGDEPELSEEIAALFDQLRRTPTEKLPHVVLNFSAVGYLNSSHIASLLRLRKRVAEGRRKLVLCGLSDEVWSVMLLTGLDKVFTFCPDTMTALAQVQLGGSDGAGGP